MANEERKLPIPARAYITAMGLAGFAAVFYTFQHGAPELSARFALYLLIAVAGSGMRVTLPGVFGSISVNYVFTFLSLLEFRAPETMALAIVSVVVQTWWKAQVRPRPVQFFFNIATICATVVCASFVYDHPFSTAAEAQLLRLALAGGVYYLVNTLSVAVVICLAEGRNLRTVFKNVFDWAFTYYLMGVCLAEMVHLSIQRIGWSFTIALLPVLYMIYRSYRVYMDRMAQEKKHAESTAALHVRTIEALAMAIEAKDECTHEHLCRVQVYALKIAEHLELPDDQKRALHAASILHDIGKLAVPDYIISKPGKLTAEEFDKMKIHTVVGESILNQVGFPYPVAPIVRSHHEKWDGTGYPDGLAGEAIPIGARILSAVDCLDALASDRQYRRALPLDEAMEYVASMAGRSFDPNVVEVLKKHYREFEDLAKQAPAQARLDKELVIRRGEAPEAGLEAENPAGRDGAEHARQYLSSIAAARHEVQTILEITQHTSGALRLEETLLLVGERLKKLTPFDCMAVYVRHGNALKLHYAQGDGSRFIRRVDVPLGQGVSGWVAENGKPMLNGNPSVEPGYDDDGGISGYLRSAISVPLNGASQHFSGALTLYKSDANAYTKDHLRILLAVVDKISRAVESAIRFQEAKAEANTDELTGLPNARSLFMHLENEVARCQAAQKRLAVVVCDLDGFKHVNDNFGHLTGNEMLRRVARILEANCRETDYISRMGGDEFVAILGGIRPEELESKLATFDDQIRKASRDVCGEENVGISAGVAYYPEDGSNAEQLLSHADNEMYDRKRARKANSGKVLQLKRTNGKVAIA